MSPAGTCSICGRPVGDHGRHVRFELPDPVLSLPDREATAGTWMSHATPAQSVMMQVPALGAFVRALLLVHLTDSDSLTFGVWIAIDPRGDRLRSIFELWWDEQRYPGLVLDGQLANAIPPWGLLRSPVHAEVRDPTETPYCVSSTDDALAAVLANEWDRTEVLTAAGQL